MDARWEHYPHDADVGVRGFGRNTEEAFEQAALAVSALHVDPRDVHEARAVELRCEAGDRERLLVDWLNAVVFELTAGGTVFHRFHVRFDGPRLEAVGFGEPVDPARHDVGVEVKGATFTDLRVAPADGGVVAQCVVDV